MKKFVSVLLLLSLLFALPAYARQDLNVLDQTAKKYLPSDSVLKDNDKEDGMYQLEYYSKSAHAEYEVMIDKDTLEVLVLETKSKENGASTSVQFKQEDIQNLILSKYPTADIFSITLHKKLFSYTYQVSFVSNNTIFYYEMSPETGFVIEGEIYFLLNTRNAAAFKSVQDIKDLLALQSPAITLTALEVDYDDREIVYDLEGKDTEYRYEIEMDAKTGKIVDLERKKLKKDDVSDFFNGKDVEEATTEDWELFINTQNNQVI